MVAYWFPPLAGIGSLRAAKMAEYLPDSGWRPMVLAPAATAHPQDVSLRYPEESVVRARSLEISRVGGAVGGGREKEAGGATPGAIRAALRRFAHRYVYYPDAQVGWFPFAVRAGLRALERERFDAIFSSSVPVTSHLIARTLHRRTGIPWVAEFRDPWADLAQGERDHARRDRLERSILRDATAVVTVSPTWRDRFLEKGARRVHVVTNGFDPADMPGAHQAEGLVVTYLGTHYWRQDLSTLWEALARIRTGDRASSIRIRFVGEIDAETRDDLARRGLSDILEVTGRLPHRAALAAAAASTVLVGAAFGPDRPFADGHVPAKIFEYLGIGLPTVYLASAATDAARILSAQPACHVVESGDVGGMVDALRRAAREGTVDRDLAPYTRQSLARQLAAVLESVRA